jgi:hypothetical protein
MIVYKTQPFGACSESVELVFSAEVVVTSGNSELAIFANQIQVSFLS